MKLLLERTIELLRLQVKDNLQQINKNQARILEIIKMPVSERKQEDYDQCYAENMRLLVENNDFITMQLNMVDFLEKHKDSPAFADDVPEGYIELPDDENVIFDMTVNDELKYDKLHPLFRDSAFFNKLINYYTAIEAYEKCSELYRFRNPYHKA